MHSRACMYGLTTWAFWVFLALCVSLLRAHSATQCCSAAAAACSNLLYWFAAVAGCLLFSSVSLLSNNSRLCQLPPRLSVSKAVVTCHFTR
jgi:hypothetical protein